ncbi:NAD-dependent epimerase/dehydratase family protein [Labrys monachus]|uniref:Nucleoside-diphosphate-sugar epimerase n=1 Tax=Labrys monachus TaxID=217067 RepID=A0ABU0FDM6_9HYPH|nr:NAD(P)-dependent oxidoreductase [Labrys monachus]MDQ0392175.1 nucleoside-diphosphate-sugar epimerase [Labrys monachus]
MTGGTGFVGRWVVQALRRYGAEVVLCTRGASGEASPGVILADLLDPDAADEVVSRAKPDIILHAAWCVEHGQFWQTPANLDWAAATLRLARAAGRHGVRRFVGIGTCFEYDWPEEGDCIEGRTPIRPTTLYAVTKDATRRILAEYAALQAFEFAWGRLFYLFGPWEHPDRLAASVAIRLARREPAPLSSGSAVRDFIDIRDAGDALAALALSPVQGAVNIASGRGLAIADIAGMLQRAAGQDARLLIGALPDRPNEPPRIVADISRLRDEVGYTPGASTEERLTETYHWWREHLDQNAAAQ